MPPIDIQTFFCLVCYYKRFVESFSSNTNPLTQLTQKKVMFLLSDACEDYFGKLKDKFNSTHVQNLPESIVFVMMDPVWNQVAFDATC